MRTATLERIETGDDGTYGLFTSDSGFQCYTGELPWRGDAHDISCIASGIYVVNYRLSVAHKKNLYHVEYANRPGTEIHSGNWVGDVSRGLRSDAKGCVIPGRAIGELVGQKAVISSRDALEALENDLERLPFRLTIKWRPGIGPS